MTTAEIAAMPDPYALLSQIREGQWDAFKTYGCPCCGFDSTSKAITEEHVHGHIRGALAERRQNEPPAVTLFDAEGNLIAKGEA